MEQTKIIPKHPHTKEVSNTIEIYKSLIQVENALNYIYLSHQEVTLLAYYGKYGISRMTEKLFAENENVSSNQIVYNLKFSLKKNKILTKNENTDKWEIPNYINLAIEDTLAILIKVKIK